MARRIPWLLIVVPALLPAAQPRFARLGDFEGAPEVQVHAADAWQPALRNTPLLESSRIRSDANGRIEIEFEEGSAVRLVGDALAELSDYTRLSTGQRITLIALDHGVAYFTGDPPAGDTLCIAVPGAQVMISRGSRVRFEVADQWSQIAVLEGLVRFSTTSAELEIREGQMARVQPGSTSHFSLFREIPALESDRWNEQRDKAESQSTSAAHLPHVRYGASDLDQNGSWIHTENYGVAWKPKVSADWTPFQAGKWVWYDELGYTWIAAESWGWAPYHHGRWMQDASLGWIWAPGESSTFKPGEVYWMRGPDLAAWGPLAPNETWTGSRPPQLFAALNTALSKFSATPREFAPDASLTKPKDFLSVAAFTVALPSPPFIAARLDIVRAPLRAAPASLLSAIQESAPRAIQSTVQSSVRPAPQTPPAEQQSAPIEAFVPPQPQPTYIVVPEPVETYYPVPVYTGVVVVNPPDRHHERHSERPPQPPVPVAEKAAVKPIVREHPEDRRPVHPTAPATTTAAPAPPSKDSSHENKGSSDDKSDKPVATGRGK